MKLCLVLNPYPIAHFTPPIYIDHRGPPCWHSPHEPPKKTLLLSDKDLLTFHYPGCCFIGILDVHQRGVGFTSRESSQRAHGPHHGKSCIPGDPNTLGPRYGPFFFSRRCNCAWIPGLANSPRTMQSQKDWMPCAWAQPTQGIDVSCSFPPELRRSGLTPWSCNHLGQAWPFELSCLKGKVSRCWCQRKRLSQMYTVYYILYIYVWFMESSPHSCVA